MAGQAIGIPAGGLPVGRAPERRRRRAVLLLLVLGALGALVVLVFLLGYYAWTRRPLGELPVVSRVAQPIPPRRLFSFAQVARPVGIAVSPDGQRIYVAEGGGDRLIKVFDREGRPVGQMAPPDSRPGTRNPGHLAVDATGRLYAVDRLRGAVDMYSQELEWEGLFASAAVAELGGWVPNGASVGPDGRLYVTDIGQAEHSVLVFTPDGTLLDRLGKSSGIPAGLNYPAQAVADDEGRIYISDGNNGRVVIVSPRGVAAVGAAGGEAMGLTRGLAIRERNVLVTDAVNHRVVAFALGDSPAFLHAFGVSSDSEGLAYPNAVAADRTGRIYVADRMNDRTQVWTY